MAISSPTITPEDKRRLHALTKHLSEPKQTLYWIDFILTVVISWGAFLIAIQSPQFSLLQICSTAVSGIGFYKGVNFVHEISHHPRELRGLAIAYNFTIGFYTRVLSYFGNSHSDHHSARKFGTLLDPEYEKWSSRHPANVLRPAVASFFSPILMFVRIAIIPFFYLIAGSRFRKMIVTHFSSIVMNFAYEQHDEDGETAKSIARIDFILMILTWAVIVICYNLEASASLLIVHYATLVIAHMLGSFRALGVHRYVSEFNQQPVDGQFFDSVSIRETFFSSLWGPLSSNYHSIHHLLPHLPYHSMQEAHRVLMKDARWACIYGQTVEDSLITSLAKMYRRAARNRRATTATRHRLSPAD